jgi:hypothetical protein
MVSVQRLKARHRHAQDDPVVEMLRDRRGRQESGQRRPVGAQPPRENFQRFRFVGAVVGGRGGPGQSRARKFVRVERIVDRVRGERGGRPGRRRALRTQVSNEGAAVDRLQRRLQPALAPRLPAGRADAETKSLALVGLQRRDRDVAAERRDDAMEAPTQIGTHELLVPSTAQDAPDSLGAPSFQRIASPPGAHDAVALDDFLESAQSKRMAGAARHQAGGKTGSEPVA